MFGIKIVRRRDLDRIQKQLKDIEREMRELREKKKDETDSDERQKAQQEFHELHFGKPSATMTMDDFMQSLEQTHDVTMVENAHQRAWRTIVKEPGTEIVSLDSDDEEIRRRARAAGLERGESLEVPKALVLNYYGRDWELASFREFLEGSAKGNIFPRTIPLFLGKASTAKTSIVGDATLELTGEIRGGIRAAAYTVGTEIYAIEGCPMHEHPRRLIPMRKRQEYRDKLGVWLDPEEDICQVCSRKLLQLLWGAETEEERKNAWRKMGVVRIKMSRRRGVGYGLLLPMDPVNLDMGEIRGKVNLTMMDRYPEGHPLTLLYSGRIHQGEQGILWVDEIWKNPQEANTFYLHLSQSKIATGPGGYGTTFADLLIIGTSNEEEWRNLRSDPSNEPLVSRCWPVLFRDQLQMTAEVETYRKLLRQSPLGRKTYHAAPLTLETQAFFAIATRIPPDAIDQHKSLAGLVAVLDGRDPFEGKDPGDLPSVRDLIDDFPRIGLESSLTPRDGQRAIEASFAQPGDDAHNCDSDNRRLCITLDDIFRTNERHLRNRYFGEDEVRKDEANKEYGALHRYLKLLDDTRVEYSHRKLHELLKGFFADFFSEKAEAMFLLYVRACEEFAKQGYENNFNTVILHSVEKAAGIKRDEAAARRKELAEQWSGMPPDKLPQHLATLFEACAFRIATEYKEDLKVQLAEKDSACYLALARYLKTQGCKDCCVPGTIAHLAKYFDNILRGGS